jgi:hypothetical protein
MNINKNILHIFCCLFNFFVVDQSIFEYTTNRVAENRNLRFLNSHQKIKLNIIFD